MNYSSRLKQSTTASLARHRVLCLIAVITIFLQTTGYMGTATCESALVFLKVYAHISSIESPSGGHWRSSEDAQP
jgi:hypothetical protein